MAKIQNQMNFDSVTELSEYLLSDPPQKSQEPASAGRTESWHGGITMSLCRDILSGKKRWSKADEMINMYTSESPEVMAHTEKITIVNSYAGSSVAMGRYLRGHPKAMRKRKKVHCSSGKVVSILMNSAVSSSVSEKDIMLRGAITMAVCQSLMACGYTPEVTMCSSFSRGRSDDSPRHFECNVKFGRSSFSNMSVLAFVMCSPGFFRRGMFRVYESVVKPIYCYGYPSKSIEEESYDIVIPHILQGGGGSEAMETIKKLTGKFTAQQSQPLEV